MTWARGGALSLLILLAGCAETRPPLVIPIGSLDPGAAMRAACIRNLTKAGPVNNKWRVWCSARGINAA